MKTIQNFIQIPFIQAVEEFYRGLNIPVNVLSNLPTSAADILGNDNFNYQIEDVYPYGIINDAIFDKENTFSSLEEIKTLKTDYEGILLFGITLKSRQNDLLPTRSQLADITRAVNRAFPFTPVNIIFKYDKYIALANTERMQYKQAWREGEKMGKVSLLRDIDCENVHSGHIRILHNLEIARSGKNAINDFESLYKYWQEVLSVSILNKVFYKELQNWYFWAIKEVRFPDEPLQIDFDSLEKYDEALKEHKGKNVIRLLTRLLFIWFIKEKGLIPEEIFDEREIAKNFIDGFTPQKPEGMFANGKYSSKYYRAILQNLFFATLNQPRNEREFRSDGKHLNATQLMRYKSYLKKPEYFIELMESKVPFMNGGLFECLDKPHPTLKGPQGGDRIIYVDGFSDRDDNVLVVPDFLFFDADEEVDLSSEYGNAKAKKEKTRGLFTILKSYKFTITENTPIDEEVALDPELLGKVFENLLASYNPETKTTARKQTGSFYTPREIVNYMVEESLIAYLKNELLHEEVGVQELGKKQIALFGNETKAAQLTFETKIDESPFKGKEDELDIMLHQLVSYSDINPFVEYPEVQKKIIKALDNCKILDPACGSGAYPMGILQKMVHILHKIDPNNVEWKQRQIDRVNEAIDRLELLDDAEFKNKSIKELKAQIADIEEAFNNNELDYGRKLYLIENCIYGVDIQPIATQISKLRFFISLVVDQKVDAAKDNFGVRPLPNLETKFVAANTLIGLPKQKAQGSLFDKREVKKMEDELKKVRHKLFSVKTPGIKRELRVKDKELREKMSEALAEQFGNETAQLLAKWDPYDQNTSSPFFDKEWMFDLNEGFHIVIGNPPYVQLKWIDNSKDYHDYETYVKSGDIYSLFYENSTKLLRYKGIGAFITSNKWMKAEYGKPLRDFLVKETVPEILIDFGGYKVFESATVDTNILIWSRSDYSNSKTHMCQVKQDYDNSVDLKHYVITNSQTIKFEKNKQWLFLNEVETKIKLMIEEFKPIADWNLQLYYGILTGANPVFIIDSETKDALCDKDFKNVEIIKPILRGQDLVKFGHSEPVKYLINSFSSVKKEGLKSIRVDKEYPTIFDYFESFGESFKKRGEKGEFWFNLRSCNYILEFEKPKIIYADIVQNGGKFYYDENKYFTNDTAFIIRGENLKYITLVLNSMLVDYSYKKFYSGGSLGDTGLRFKKEFIERIPIPDLPSDNLFIDNLHDILSYVAKEKYFELFYSISNALVFNLYFPLHMEELGINVLELIKHDMESYIGEREFANLSDKEEKEKVIENLYSLWSDPDNEVRNRIKLFAVRSPLILKPIIEK